MPQELCSYRRTALKHPAAMTETAKSRVRCRICGRNLKLLFTQQTPMAPVGAQRAVSQGIAWAETCC